MKKRQIADIDTWNMHMTALKRILDARGGADSVKLPNLRFIIFLVDTAGCCKFGFGRDNRHIPNIMRLGLRDTRPRFGLPVHILPDAGSLYLKFSVPVVVEEQLSRLVRKYPRTKELSEIIRDLSIVVQYFDEETKKDPNYYQPSDTSGLWLLPLIHRCLDQIPIEPDLKQPELVVLEALRHATILFMQPIRKRFGVDPGPFDQRVRELGAVLRFSSSIWRGLEPLFRWIVLAGGIEAKAIEERVRFAAMLATYEPFQEMHQDEHLRALRSFIWKQDIFEEPFADYMSLVEDIKLCAPMWPPSKSALRLYTMR